MKLDWPSGLEPLPGSLTSTDAASCGLLLIYKSRRFLGCIRISYPQHQISPQTLLTLKYPHIQNIR